jgi:hypothetical protein
MTDDLNDGARRGWYSLDKYRILAMPLPTNEFFTTHRIFHRGELIGRQLSVPSISDCEWFNARRGIYARAEESTGKIFGYSERAAVRRGRPTNEERARRQAWLAQIQEEIA